MAFIPKSGITTGGTIQAAHVVNIIESLDGTGLFDIVASGSFSGSFQGDASGMSGAISASYSVSSSFAETASFIDPTFISASAAASGFGAGGGGVAFPFSGSAQITGSLNVTGSITILDGAYTNYTTQSVPLTIQTGYNALLVGPLFNASSITIQPGARLVIL